MQMMARHRVASQTGIACSGCALRDICWPVGVDGAQRCRLDSLIRKGRPLETGGTLFRARQGFESIYAVRMGSMKSVALAADGSTQVNGFYLPGEVLGLEGIAEESYPCCAVALEPTRYCEIPFRALRELSVAHRGLREEVPRILSRALLAAHERTRLVTMRRAQARLAAFLVDIARRRERSRLDASKFRLSMMRFDIASYLGLKIETVSRGLHELQEEGVLAVHGREIAILDPGRLAAVAEDSPDDCVPATDSRAGHAGPLARRAWRAPR